MAECAACPIGWTQQNWGGVISTVDWQSMLMWGPPGGSSGATLAASCRPVTIGQDKPAANAAWWSDRPMVSGAPRVWPQWGQTDCWQRLSTLASFWERLAFAGLHLWSVPVVWSEHHVIYKLMGTREAEADKNCHELKLLIVDPQSAMPAAS